MVEGIAIEASTVNSKTIQPSTMEIKRDTEIADNVTNGHKELSHSSSMEDNKKANTKTVQIEGEDDSDDEEVDISCGIWKLRTNMFGKYFSNLYLFAMCVGLASLFTSMVTEIIQVQLTSIERQFNIDNAKAGLFDTASKSGYLCAILLAGHFTKKAHIPVLIGLSGIVQGLILLVPPILQFVHPYKLPIVSSDNSSEASDNDNYVCIPLNANMSSINATVEPPKEVNQVAYNVLIVLQVVKGVTDVFHSGFLPAIYMDDNLVDKSRMGILLGIQSVFQMLASPLGREINGIISDIPIDLKDTLLSPKDHRFVSAWWLGFLIFGIGTILFSLPVLLFPSRLITKRARKLAADKAVVTFAGGHVNEEIEVKLDDDTPNESSSRKTSATSKEISTDIRKQSIVSQQDVSESVRKQSVSSHYTTSRRRRSSLFPTLSGPTERRVSIAGDIVFEQPIKNDSNKEDEHSTINMIKDFPRALYRLFRKPIFLLMVFDVVLASVPMGGIAFFRSSYMAFEYNVSMSRVAFLSGVSSAVGNTVGAIVSSWLSSRVTTKVGYILIIFFAYLIATCMTPLYLIFGCDNAGVYGAPGEIGLAMNTSSTCTNCDDLGQLLACGDDGNNYFSPCYAGCTNVQNNVFFNCSLLSNNTIGSNAVPGLCASDCERNFLIYVFVHGLQNLVTATTIIAYKLLILRSVDTQDRALSISVYIFFYIIVGIPAPNLFGRIIDGACYISDGDACALYNRDIIRYLMSGVDVALHASSQLTSLMMLFYFKYEQRQTDKKQKKEAKNKTEVAVDAVNEAEVVVEESSRKETDKDNDNSNEKKTRL